MIRSTPVQTLWQVSDRGVPVFAHSVDVALLVLDGYPDAREKFPGFRLDVVLLGATLHDLSKASARHGGGKSHSQIMNSDPTVAVEEALSVLDDAQSRAGVWLDRDGIEHLWHAIAAHHGTWGAVSPHTPEAWLLHNCDNYSATHHRIAPIDANDILPLTDAGYSWTQIGERLGVNRSVVKSRLVEACRAEGVRATGELIDRWRVRGVVVVGDQDRARQIERARRVIEFARRCPSALVDRVRGLLPLHTDHSTIGLDLRGGPLVDYPDRAARDL